MSIGYKNTTPFGGMIASLVSGLISEQAVITRIMNGANSATAGGTQLTNIETDPLFGVGTGNGQAFYTALQSIQAGLNAIDPKVTLAGLDQGG